MSEFEMQLHNLAINPEKIKHYQVLCLPVECPPENFENAKPTDRLCYTRDSEELCRLLKKSGIKCANHDDLGIDALYYKRAAAAADLYFAALCILAQTALDKIIDAVIYIVWKRKEEASKPNIQINIPINIQNCNIIFPEGGKFTTENFEGDSEDFIKYLTALKQRIDKI